MEITTLFKIPAFLLVIAVLAFTTYYFTSTRQGLTIRIKWLNKKIDYNTKKGYYVKASRQTGKVFNLQKRLDSKEY